jgi:Protein of unknown function (DUF2975)
MTANRILGISVLALRGVAIALSIFLLVTLIAIALAAFGPPLNGHLGDFSRGLHDGFTDGIRDTSYKMSIVALNAVCVIVIFGFLSNILSRVKRGNIFVKENISYLLYISVALFFMQMADIVRIYVEYDSIKISNQLSISGWIGALVAFLLSNIFAEGMRLNDEAQFTV